MVKELKEKFLRGKTIPLLSKVEDIHAITGLLKDFLRNLKEPLLTFRLNSNFMDAAGESELEQNVIRLSHHRNFICRILYFNNEVYMDSVPKGIFVIVKFLFSPRIFLEQYTIRLI